ncbi:MAG TPA: addiction module protein [Gemmata sp.]|nr:addiction module protein [Gemmata sp.]
MTTTADQLLATLLQLPSGDRGELAAKLLESLDDPADADADAAWDAEIRDRVEEMKQGRVKPVSWADARSQILADDDDGGS